MKKHKLKMLKHSLFWLENGAVKRNRLTTALEIIDQELRDTPREKRTVKRFSELVRARHNLWELFLGDWQQMIKDAKAQGKVSDEVLAGWETVEELAVRMISQHLVAVDKLPELPEKTYDTPKCTISFKMKMD